MDFSWVVPMKTHSFMGHENFPGFHEYFMVYDNFFMGMFMGFS